MVADVNTENQPPVLSSGVRLNEKKLFLADERKSKKRVLVENQETRNRKRKLDEKEGFLQAKRKKDEYSENQEGFLKIKISENEENLEKSSESKKFQKETFPEGNQGRSLQPKNFQKNKEIYSEKKESSEESSQSKKSQKKNIFSEENQETSLEIQNFQKNRDICPEEISKLVVLVRKINRRWCRRPVRRSGLECRSPEVPVVVPDSGVFLKRTHMGFRMKDFDEDLLREKTSFENYLLRKNIRKMEKRDSKKSKKNEIEYDLKKVHGVVDCILLKRSLFYFLLNENTTTLYGGNRAVVPSGTFVIFDFYNLQSTTMTMKFGKTDIYVFGLDSGKNQVTFEDHFCSHLTSTSRELCSWQSFEYTLPKPTLDFDELYIFVELAGESSSDDPQRMRLKSSNRSTPRSSSSSASSTPVRAFGALRIAKKSAKQKYYQSPWDVNYGAKAVHLLDEAELEKNYLPISKTELKKKLEELSKKADTVRRTGKGHSLILELQNPRGFGSFEKEEIDNKTVTRITRSRKKQSSIQDRDDPEEITYDFSGCSSDDVLIATKGLMKLPIQYNTINRLTSLFQPKRLETVVAHKPGSRSYLCIFCKKTMTSLPALKFHLQYSYPSFDFGFTKSSIKITFDKEKLKESAEKLRENTSEALIKNSTNSGPDTVEPRRPKLSKKRGYCGLVNEPPLVTTTLTPYPGLKRIEMNYEIIAELSNRNMQEILDVEQKEIEFYDLWNRFILKSENRVHSVNQLASKVLKFASENTNVIRDESSRLVWMAFLLHLRPQLTEFELMEAATMGTEFEGNWTERSQMIQLEEEQRHSRRGKEASVESSQSSN